MYTRGSGGGNLEGKGAGKFTGDAGREFSKWDSVLNVVKPGIDTGEFRGNIAQYFSYFIQQSTKR